MIDGPAIDTMTVDRAGLARNPRTRALVNASRRRLVAGALPASVCADALVQRSARLAFGHLSAIGATLALIALIGVPILGSLQTIVWGAVAIPLCVLLALLARARAAGWRWAGEAAMQGVHVLLAAAWTAFVMVECSLCIGDASAVYRADALLVGMAVSALVHAHVRHALPLTYVAPVAAMAVHVEAADDMVGLAMLGMALGGLVLFSFVAARTRAAALAATRLEFEKDGLIAELETEKSASDAARQRAEEASLAKSRFLASMSHELRTPLNAIMGFSEMMKDEVLGPLGSDIYREYATDIHGSGQHLLSLINEILDLSRIEAGRYSLQPEPVHLADAAAEAIATLRVRASSKGIAIGVRGNAALPPVLADQRAIRQVLLNLLSNAVKFTPTGGAIEVIVGRTAGGGQYVTVADNGPGIPEAELPLVLSAFGQGSIAIKSAEQGTGLGLAIVQALVNMHGGGFKLASRLREGTRATFTLPANPAFASIARDMPTRTRPIGPRSEDLSNARDDVPLEEPDEEEAASVESAPGLDASAQSVQAAEDHFAQPSFVRDEAA